MRRARDAAHARTRSCSRTRRTSNGLDGAAAAAVWLTAAEHERLPAAGARDGPVPVRDEEHRPVVPRRHGRARAGFRVPCVDRGAMPAVGSGS